MANHSFNTLIVCNTGIPLYIQVIDSLTDSIKLNTFNPGYQLPGEVVLCRFFNVSRTVIGQDLKDHEYIGHRRQSEVLKHEKVPATYKIADYLALEECTSVVQIDRLFDQEPVYLVTSHLQPDLVPELDKSDLTNRSLYMYLENRNGIQMRYHPFQTLNRRNDHEKNESWH